MNTMSGGGGGGGGGGRKKLAEYEEVRDNLSGDLLQCHQKWILAFRFFPANKNKTIPSKLFLLTILPAGITQVSNYIYTRFLENAMLILIET